MARHHAHQRIPSLVCALVALVAAGCGLGAPRGTNVPGDQPPVRSARPDVPTAGTTSSPPVAEPSPITPTPTSEAIDGVWLYQLVAEVDAVGPSGEQRQATIGEQTSDTSTTFWVGCSGAPAITTFHLGGSFDHVSAILALDDGTPADLVVRVTFHNDGRQAGQWSLRPGDTIPVQVNTSGVEDLALHAQAVSGVCGGYPIGYGIAFNGAAYPG